MDESETALCYAEARDPRTPAARLRELASRPHRVARRVINALAENPSTPPDALIRLAELSPAAFCRNPIAPLVSLEMPDFASRIGIHGVFGLLRSGHAPAVLVTQWAVAGANEGNNGKRGNRAGEIIEAARWHVTQGEAIPDAAWNQAILSYWLQYIAGIKTEAHRHELYELVDYGWLPSRLAERVGPDPQPWADREGFRRRIEMLYVAFLERAARHPRIMHGRDLMANEVRLYQSIREEYDLAAPDYCLAAWAAQLPDVGQMVISRADAPAEMVAGLAERDHALLRRAALRNPKLTREQCEQLRERRQWQLLRRVTDMTDVSSYARSAPRLLLRFAALLHAPECVRRPLWGAYATSPVWEARLAAAVAITSREGESPLKPRHWGLLRDLSADGNRLVRAAARARLRGEGFTWE